MGTSIYAGHSLDKPMISGGGIQITISTAAAVTISSQPCRMAYIMAGNYSVANTGGVKFCVGATATSAVGIRVPSMATTVALSVGGIGAEAIMIPVDNLNKLSFFSLFAADEDKVDVMWLR